MVGGGEGEGPDEKKLREEKGMPAPEAQSGK